MTPRTPKTYEFFKAYRATVRRQTAVVSHVNIVARSSIEAEELAYEFTRDRLRQLGGTDPQVVSISQELDVQVVSLDSPDHIADWLGPLADDAVAMRKQVA